MTAINPRKFTLCACLLLALGTVALYWPVTGYPFINFDDSEYIYENSVVQAGLTGTGFKWAFNGIHVSNWHPLTWLSHMLDCQLFGVQAGWHHFVNVLFHVANSLLLFFFLRHTTNAPWRSAFVAAIFAWHPLHVESVAWISERKDVLSTFFWLLTLIAYARYANEPKAQGLKPKAFYMMALVFSASALLSKPMAVTLPFTLLLIDLWPLKRLSLSDLRLPILKRLVLEKIPFFALSFALCLITFLAQRGGGAVSPVEWTSRLGNVPVAYARYLAKTFWPSDLAIVYPYVYQWPVFAIIGSVLLILLVSALAVALLRRKPWLAVGWFWFLGTLVPVIGLVQVGAQSMADRYSYIPSIGLLVVITWAAADFFSPRPNGKLLLGILGGSALASCLLATSLQITHWRGSISLFLHAIQVTQNNYVAHNALGKAFENRGNLARAEELYREAVRMEPRYAVSQYNYGLILVALGKDDEALEHLAAAAKLDPNNADAQFNLGIFFLQKNRFTNAVQCFEATLKIRPNFATGHYRLGQTLAKQHQFSEAATQFREALRLQPDFPEAKKELDALLAEHPELK